MNLNIRLIAEEKKTYLSVEGSINEASDAEKVELAKAIQKTILIALKIDSNTEGVEIVNDFVREETNESEKQSVLPKKKDVKSEVTEVVIQTSFEEILIQTQEDPNDQIAETSIDSVKNGLSSPSNRVKKTLGFGSYSKMTAEEILKKDGVKGANYLKWCLEKAVKVKSDQDLRNDILLSIAEYAESIRNEINELTSCLDSETANDIVCKFFAAHGSTLESAVLEKDIQLLMKVLTNLKTAYESSVSK